MVRVSKKYVKKADLIATIEQFLETYERVRVEFPSNVEQHFLVKAWEKKPERIQERGGGR